VKPLTTLDPATSVVSPRPLAQAGSDCILAGNSGLFAVYTYFLFEQSGRTKPSKPPHFAAISIGIRQNEITSMVAWTASVKATELIPPITSQR